MDLFGYKRNVLRLAEQASGEWVKIPDIAEYAAAAQRLQADGSIEMDAFNPLGLSVRVIKGMNSA